jgi:hypothetical protein
MNFFLLSNFLNWKRASECFLLFVEYYLLCLMERVERHLYNCNISLIAVAFTIHNYCRPLLYATNHYFTVNTIH